MRTHLQRDLERLTQKLLAVGAMVEEAFRNSMEALTERRGDLAEEVIRGDELIDDREVDVEEDCLKVLALHAPVAADLRRVVAFLKLNNDLERVGDLAKNIAERAAFLATRDEIDIPAQIPEMAEKAQGMLRDCLDAVVNADTELAQKVVADDEIVDDMHGGFYRLIEERIAGEPERARENLQLLSVSRYLERIADQATNVAEDVVFMVEGEVIRHQGPPAVKAR
ncbi:MAG TPA: phosphate signaling complex protein PhoU [Thermoanaerobaculia bacterium]|nr:phosphate signaling complex protein PhoU [Thermoanaerobaculia bacterium]